MKYALTALLAFFLQPLTASAQKQYLYTDVGLSLAYFDPGFSATYNYNISRHIGLGAGAQAYVFHPAATSQRQFTPAIFLDWRFLIRPKHISQYSIIWDIGYDFYKHNNGYEREGNYAYSVPHDNGTYIGLGLGYFLRLTDRGWGSYVTLKMINNFCTEDRLDIASGEQKSLTTARGTLVVSFGFRFGDDSKKVTKSK